MPYRLSDPPDQDIVWLIQLFNSHPQMCLAHLREAYPHSRVVLIADGDSENFGRYRAISTEFSAELVLGEHLMKFQTTHDYVTRLLQHAVSGRERYVFRIDPDTRIWRRFSWLPEIACAFGTLESVTVAFQDRIRHPPNIQGGCIGLARDVCLAILDQNILNYDACVTHARSGWVRNRDCEHVTAKGMMLDDFVLSWAADAAGFPLLPHAEIASYWRDPVSNETLQYAVTHPHKDMDSPARNGAAV